MLPKELRFNFYKSFKSLPEYKRDELIYTAMVKAYLDEQRREVDRFVHGFEDEAEPEPEGKVLKFKVVEGSKDRCPNHDTPDPEYDDDGLGMECQPED